MWPISSFENIVDAKEGMVAFAMVTGFEEAKKQNKTKLSRTFKFYSDKWQS